WILPDAKESEHGSDERIRARPGPGGLHHRMVRGDGNRVVEPAGGGRNGVVDLRRRLPIPADEQPLDVLSEASLHGRRRSRLGGGRNPAWPELRIRSRARARWGSTRVVGTESGQRGGGRNPA